MKLQRLALAAAGLGLLAVTTSPVQAIAAEPGPSVRSMLKQLKTTPVSPAGYGDTCEIPIASPTVGGEVGSVLAIPAKPPRADLASPFAFFPSRANATWYGALNSSGTQFYFHGLFVEGGTLYRHTTVVPDEGDPIPRRTRIGGGWDGFRAIQTSNYSVGAPKHSYLYGLHSNGRLYRYASSGAGFKALGSFPGFASFKAMAVISETATYDTLLMTTRQGALYTFRIPVAASAQPIRKTVRTSGWASFESLAAYTCGTRGGASLVGVDHDTKSGYIYGMSKANGPSTSFVSYGKVPATFDGVNHVLMTGHYDQLSSE